MKKIATTMSIGILLVSLIVLTSVCFACKMNSEKANWQISESGEFITPPGKESSIEFTAQNGYSFGTAVKIVESGKTTCIVENSDGEIAIIKAYDNGNYEISYYGDLAGSHSGKY